MNRTLTVARYDFLNVRRSKLVWFVCSIYSLLAALVFYFAADGGGGVLDALWSMIGMAAFVVVPLVALVASYLAVAGERERGSVKMVLGLPTSRSDVVLGKLLSRATLVVGAIVLAYLVGAVITAAMMPAFKAGIFVKTALLTVLFTLSYVSIAVGISAATGSRSRAMGGAIGFFFVFNLLWMFGNFSIVGALNYVLNDLLNLGVSDAVLTFLQMLSPAQAYFFSLGLAFPGDFRAFQNLPPEWFLQPEAGLVVLLAWTVLPLAVGYLRFRSAELG